MPIVATHDLSKRYRSLRGKSVMAADSVSISVEQGQVFGFLGPNGSGKTTTIGMLLGIIRPTGGRFSLFGSSAPKDVLAARSCIGATIETPNFYPYLSGRDNLRIAATIKGVGHARVEECLSLVDLADQGRRRFRAYSMGMKQRLALAAAMLNDPELIILDEPANGLDPQGMRDIRRIIRSLAARGRTIFLSSHLLWEVERVCSHVAIIHKGKILTQGSVEEVVSQGTRALLRADTNDEILNALKGYAAAAVVRQTEEGVIVTLTDGDLVGVNRFLARQGIYLSHLAPYRDSLESIFMDLTDGKPVPEDS
ncbi:MAG: ABC transporter ATP-binding protein [Bacteroidota bacterium]|nr:ABC transporter ATP-binding protein [Bacteroidota bacterium]